MEHILGYIVKYKDDGQYKDRYKWRERRTPTLSKARIYYSKAGAYGSCVARWDRENRRMWYDYDKVELIPLVVEE